MPLFYNPNLTLQEQGIPTTPKEYGSLVRGALSSLYTTPAEGTRYAINDIYRPIANRLNLGGHTIDFLSGLTNDAISVGYGTPEEPSMKKLVRQIDPLKEYLLKKYKDTGSGRGKVATGFGISLPNADMPKVEEAPEFTGERERPHPAAILVGGGLSALGDALAYGFSKGRVGGKFDANDYIRSLREMKDRIYTDKLNKYKMDIENKDKKFDKEYKLASLANDQAYKRAYLQVAMAKTAGEGDNNNFLRQLAQRVESQKALEKSEPGFFGRLFGRTSTKEFENKFQNMLRSLGLNGRRPTPEELTEFILDMSNAGLPVDEEYLNNIYSGNVGVPLRAFSLSAEKNVDPYGVFETNKKFGE